MTDYERINNGPRDFRRAYARSRLPVCIKGVQKCISVRRAIFHSIVSTAPGLFRNVKLHRVAFRAVRRNRVVRYYVE